jgi:RNA polymerase sigma-70 factor (ECF subfamily)
MCEVQITSQTDVLLAVDGCELVAALVEAAKNGSEPAFEELFRLYRKPLYHITYSITRHREDAEDALQDAFLRAYANLSAFRHDSQFFSWIVRIAMNCSLMLLRKRRLRNNDMSPSSASSDEPALFLDLEDKRLNPEQTFLHKQSYLKMLEAIRRLPPQLRVVAELRVFCDQSLGEIHEKLGITHAAVKSRLFRARQKLTRSAHFEHQVTIQSE